jgi:hypothetical protein
VAKLEAIEQVYIKMPHEHEYYSQQVRSCSLLKIIKKGSGHNEIVSRWPPFSNCAHFLLYNLHL